MTLYNVTKGRYLSSTKRFAVFFLGEPVRAVRLPVSILAAVAAVDAAEGDSQAAQDALSQSLQIREDQAIALLRAAVRLGVASEVDPVGS